MEPAMVFPFHLVNDNYKNPGHDRRTFGRRLQESLKSNLGPVLDISRGGLRLISRKQCDGDQEIVLKSCEGELTVKARVRWHRKVGFRKFEIGMEFIELDEKTADELVVISTLHQFAFGKAG